jgi:hypothetical protein
MAPENSLYLHGRKPTMDEILRQLKIVEKYCQEIRDEEKASKQPRDEFAELLFED